MPKKHLIKFITHPDKMLGKLGMKGNLLCIIVESEIVEVHILTKI